MKQREYVTKVKVNGVSLNTKVNDKIKVLAKKAGMTKPQMIELLLNNIVDLVEINTVIKLGGNECH